MPHPSWDNPADFVSLDDFAVKAVIQFQGGTPAPRTISGIFDEPYVEGRLGKPKPSDYQMDSVRPKLTCVEGTCTGARRGDTVVIYLADGVTVHGTYNIMTYPQKDGTGLEVLELTPAS
jgi:hypothetical protein